MSGGIIERLRERQPKDELMERAVRAQDEARADQEGGR